MLTRRKVTLCMQLIAIILMIASAVPAWADSPMPQNKVPGRVESTARRLMHDLTKAGYEVERGYFKLYTQSDCPYSFEVLGSCLGNNPAAPYVVPVLPAWGDEWVDPGTAGMLGPTVAGYNPSYRLDPREAVVILGELPPPARYFGLQTYLLSRPGKLTESDQHTFVADKIPAMRSTFFSTLPKNQERLQIFADLSDPINNVVIENKSDAVWEQLRYFVITPDQRMDGAMRKALARLGIPGKAVFTEQIPSTLGGEPMAVGLAEKSDDFVTVLRYAMPEDGGGDRTPSNRWRERLPLVVLRVRDTRPAHQPLPYPEVVWEARSGTTPPEIALADDLTTLVGAVCGRWVGWSCQPGGLLNMKASPLKLTGPECVQVGMNCLAPNEDVAYFMSPRLPLPDNNRVYAITGALGTRTGNATYVGLGLNSSLTKLGFDNIDDDTLAGTADSYGVDKYDRFFLQYFARDCTGLEALTAGSHCYSVGDKLPYCDDPEDLSCAVLVLSVRNYILPGTQRGPAAELTLSPRVITLERPSERP